MLRTALLVPSRSQRLREAVAGWPALRRATRRFVAGETLEEAIAVVRRLAGAGMLASVNRLGEDVHERAEARREADACVAILEALQAAGLPPNISVKPTHLGIGVDAEACAACVRDIVRAAASRAGFVRLAMESSAHTRATLALFERLRAESGAIGIVLQAYLYRAAKDVERLLPLGSNVRLVKGAFLEPPGVAYRSRRDVDTNFRRLAARLIEADALARGAYPAFATHDATILAWLTARLAALGVPRDRFEFQMLLGVRRDLQERLAADGYRVRVYVPFGTFWFPYFVRRLAERPANLLFVLRNLLRA